MINFESSARFNKQASIILITQEQLTKNKFDFQHDTIKEQISRLHRADKFSGEEGEIFPLVVDKLLVVLVGIGALNKTSPTALRMSIRQALLSPFLKKVRDIEIVPVVQQDRIIEATIEAVMIGGYSWDKYKTGIDFKKTPRLLDKKITIVGKKEKSVEELLHICAGVNFARDLVNENADVANSIFIEKAIKNLVKGHRDVTVDVLNEKELKKEGLNLHLAVNRGSRNEPKLIIVRYHGAAKKEPYTAFVGKGITFDTGGINLKPSGHIENMRLDMSGAACVAGILHNVLSLRIRKNVLFAVGLAENAIGAASYKPGDVIKGYAGKTVEIGNTDAEGRLVLADTLAYVIKNYKPYRIIDIATLTGACVVALGHDFTGLMSNNDQLASALLASARQTDDRLWQLPLYPELTKAIQSKIADIKNIGWPKGAGGTITAAEFLRQFVGEIPWAHLDVAGTAFVDGESRLYFGHGASGSGIRLLTHYLLNN